MLLDLLNFPGSSTRPTSRQLGSSGAKLFFPRLRLFFLSEKCLLRFLERFFFRHHLVQNHFFYPKINQLQLGVFSSVEIFCLSLSAPAVTCVKRLQTASVAGSCRQRPRWWKILPPASYIITIIYGSFIHIDIDFYCFVDLHILIHIYIYTHYIPLQTVQRCSFRRKDTVAVHGLSQDMDQLYDLFPLELSAYEAGPETTDQFKLLFFPFLPDGVPRWSEIMADFMNFQKLSHHGSTNFGFGTLKHQEKNKTASFSNFS